MSNITKDLDTLEEELDPLAPATEIVRENLRLAANVAADKIVGYEPPQRREEMPLLVLPP